MTVGCVAGDEESYEVFKDLFDPIIQDRHGGYKPTDKHKTDLNHENLKVGCPRGQGVGERGQRGGRGEGKGLRWEGHSDAEEHSRRDREQPDKETEGQGRGGRVGEREGEREKQAHNRRVERQKRWAESKLEGETERSGGEKRCGGKRGWRRRGRDGDGGRHGREGGGRQAGGEGGTTGSRRGPDTPLPARAEMTWTPTTCSAAASALAGASRATRCPPTAPAVSAGLWRSSPWKVRAPTPPTAGATRLWLCSSLGTSLGPLGSLFL